MTSIGAIDKLKIKPIERIEKILNCEMSTADLRQIILFTDVENSFSLTFTDWFY